MRFHSLYAAVGMMLLLGACAPVQPVASPAATPAADRPSSRASAAHAGHGDVVTDEDAPFDAAFIDSMIEHHQGAIEMAEAALAEAEHAELRTMAAAVIAAQSSEIAQMQQWRSEWYPDLAPTGGMQMEMGDMALSDDAGKPFDQRFIEAMISHHTGAIHMAEMALEQAEHAEIRTLAEAIMAAQQAEIEQMQAWLSEWYGVTQ